MVKFLYFQYVTVVKKLAFDLDKSKKDKICKFKRK